MNALFISEDWLKSNTPIPYNLDPKEIYSFLKTSQDIWIKDALGSLLYDELCNIMITSGVAGLSANQRKLIELIRPSLGYYTVYQAMPFLRDKIKNIGIVSTSDDKQNLTARQDYKDMRADIKNMAEYYMARVHSYLCTNGTLFPNYSAPNTDVSPNHATPYRCDLYIEDDRNCIDEEWLRRNWRHY
jgi:hypothetical protein